MDATQGKNIGPVIPSAQPEVKVRTFQSDLLSMKQSGGGLPQFQTIKAPQLPLGESGGIVHPPLITSQRALLFLIFLALIALSFLGYFVYTAFFAGVSRGQEVSPGAAGNASSNQNGQIVSPLELAHKTAFRRPTDQKLSLVLSATASSASGLRTYNQKFQDALNQADLTARFVEIETRGDDGKNLGVGNVFSAADAFVLDKDFFAGHFSPDPTIFAYREGGDFWPGYVLTLNPNENWLFLKSEVSKLEVSPKILNFFLNSPEGHGEFYDGTVGDQPVRITDFTSGGRFIYGWVRGYLVFSTSYAGFTEAVARL